jgi:hypothetical protein
MTTHLVIRTMSRAAMLVICIALSSCTARSTRLLFLGNSITYAGNLPAVFKAVCDNSSKACSTEMIVEGGATLTQRVGDHSLSKAVETHRFDYLILQERGGDYIALPGEVDNKRLAEKAAEALVRDARRSKLKPILLGTYQGYPQPSNQLVAAEVELGGRLGVPVVPVSARFICGRRDRPSLRWLDADGMHPGPDLTLLMAVLLYRELFGSYPAVMPVSINAPIYGPRNGPRASSFASAQRAPSDLVRTVTYDVATVRAVIDVARGECK